MIQAEVVAKNLDDVLESGNLAPLVDQFMDELRGNGSSFYTKTRVKDGCDAAEKELEEVVRERFLREFAGSLQPIAMGMRDVARADSKNTYTRIVRTNPDMLFTMARSQGLSGKIVGIIGLPRHKGCGCNLPDGAEIFGEHGALPLKAAFFGGFDHPAAHRLSLVFASREQGPPHCLTGYTTVTISRDGYVHGESHFPFIGPDDYLRYSLGLTPADRAFNVFTSGGGFLDGRLGFPGAEEYLARHINKLGSYLSEVAKTMKDGHK